MIQGSTLRGAPGGSTSAGWCVLLVVLAALVGLPEFAAAEVLEPPNAQSVLVLENSLSGSVEEPPELAAIEAIGGTAVLADDVDWRETVAAPGVLARYQAIVFGGRFPECLEDPAGAQSLSVALATRQSWSPVITGNIAVLGEELSANQGDGGAAQSLLESAIGYAASGNTTGAYISLSCYYENQTTPVSPAIIDQFGNFSVVGRFAGGPNSCPSQARIVNSHPVLGELTATELSGWSCSAQEGFVQVDPSFQTVAVVDDLLDSAPYIIVRDESIDTICGDGQLQTGEQCEVDPTTGEFGACCDANTCQFLPSNTICEVAQGACFDDGVCSGQADFCPGSFPKEPGSLCDDANACTIGESCNANGACLGGAPLDCNDDNVCTDDSCDPAIGCFNDPNSESCDDGNACTVGESCNAIGACVGGLPLDCDDNNVCTDEVCDPIQGCANLPNADSCDDSDACTLGDVCSGGGCQPGSLPLECDDGNECTDDSCDSSDGCIIQVNTGSCNDGDECTEGDTCDDGVCGGDPVVCEDDEVCSESVGCVTDCESVEGDECDTGLFGVCAPGIVACPGGPNGPIDCVQDEQASNEVCDGDDNDCNGAVDDDLEPLTCGVGACEVTIDSCDDGESQECEPGEPSTEICGNGVDEDCDGMADNGCDFETQKLDDWAEDLEIVEGHILVAAQSAGVQIVEFDGGLSFGDVRSFVPDGCGSNRSGPAFVEDLDVDRVNGLVYLALAECGVGVVSLSELLDGSREEPPSLKTKSIEGWVDDVHIDGDRAYVAAFEGGLVILDITSSPESLRVLGTVGAASADGFGAAIDVEVASAAEGAPLHAYVATTRGLRVVNVEDPENPDVVGRFIDAEPDIGQDVEVARFDGRLVAFLAAFESGLVMIDVSDPSAPSELTRVASRDASLEVETSEGRVFLADGRRGIRVFDITDDEEQPLVERTGFDVPGDTWDVDILGNAAYTAYGKNPKGNQTGGVAAVDIASVLTATDMSEDVILAAVRPPDCGRFCANVAGRLKWASKGASKKSGDALELDLTLDDDRRWVGTDDAGSVYSGSYHKQKRNGRRGLYILHFDTESEARLLSMLEDKLGADADGVTLQFAKHPKLKLKRSNNGKRAKLRSQIQVQAFEGEQPAERFTFEIRRSTGRVR